MSILEQKMVFGGKEVLVIFISAIVMGLVFFAVLYIQDDYSLIYYGDAVSHLYSARRFVDSQDLGILNQLGTVWLPVPHLMFLPFSLIDELLSSGIAGMIVSLPCHAVASVLIYKIIRYQFGYSYIAIIGGFLYASNPNLIYLGITAMTEAPFLLFFIAFVYYFQRWNFSLTSSENNLKYLVLASVFISLATLCRYESWIIPVVFVPFVVYTMIKRNKNKTIYTILLCLVSFSGILFWVGFNQAYYGNPLEFADSQFYSASSQTAERPYRDFLYLQPTNVLTIYGMAATMISSPILLGLSAIGFGMYLKERKNELGKLIIFLSLPPLFTLAALYIGIGEMSQWWFNARFATFLFPLVILLTCFFVFKVMPKIKHVRPAVATLIISVFIFQLLSPTFGVVTYLDAVRGWTYGTTPYAIEAGEFLQTEYDDGRIMIMTGSSQAHRIMLLSEVDFKRYDEGIEAFSWKQYVKEPWKHDKWIVMGTDPDSDSSSIVNYWKEKLDVLEQHYTQVFENEHYKIFVKR